MALSRATILLLTLTLVACVRPVRPWCTADEACAQGEVCAEVPHDSGPRRVCAIPCKLPEGQTMSRLGCPAGLACWLIEGTSQAVCVPVTRAGGRAR